MKSLSFISVSLLCYCCIVIVLLLWYYFCVSILSISYFIISAPHFAHATICSKRHRREWKNQLIVGAGLERVRWMCKAAGTKQNPIAQRLQTYKRFVIEQDRGHNYRKVLRVTIRLTVEQTDVANIRVQSRSNINIALFIIASKT